MLGIARIVAANVAFQVLRAVAGDNDGDARRRAQSIDSRVTGQASASIKAFAASSAPVCQIE
ncbi:MAG: hypothetical protein ACLRM9_02155 [Collinsella aerofaciens]